MNPMKFLASIALVIIFLNIILCPVVSSHLSVHEGCMASFVNHVEDMQGFLFAIVSVFVFSIVFLFLSFIDYLNLNTIVSKLLYERKVLIPNRTKIYWLAILFHAPPCIK